MGYKFDWIGIAMKVGVPFVAGGIGAAAVAFCVADYVVKSNTTAMQESLSAILQQNSVNFDAIQSSTNMTLTGVQTSIDRLSGAINSNAETGNESRRQNTDAILQLSERINGLVDDSASQTKQIMDLRADIGRVETAVSSAGIEMPARFHPSLWEESDWSLFRTKLDISPEQSILIEPETWSEILKDLGDKSVAD